MFPRLKGSSLNADILNIIGHIHQWNLKRFIDLSFNCINDMALYLIEIVHHVLGAPSNKYKTFTD
jgi:hypothetical protein